MTKYYKYSRTPHLPWSGGATEDDKTLTVGDLAISHLAESEVVVSLKMDGENTNWYNDYCHARSIDSKHHPSRDWVKRKWGEVAYKIPDGWKVVLENVYAQHSLKYDDLESYAYVIGLYDENRVCLDWETTVDFAENELQLPTVPVLYEGPFDAERLQEMADELDPKTQEGYVVRVARSFHYDDFGSCVAKYVRPEFKEKVDNAGGHWMHQEIVPNQLLDPEDV